MAQLNAQGSTGLLPSDHSAGETGGVQKKGVNVVEYLYAEVRQNNLGRGTDTNKAIRDWVKTIGKPKDDAGHIVGKNQGGLGTVEWNIFPQSSNFLPPVSQGWFNEFFNSMTDVSIAKTTSFTKCTECQFIKEGRQCAKTAEEKEQFRIRGENHNREQRSCYSAYYCSWDHSRQYPDTYLSIIHDKMDANKTSLARLQPVLKDCSNVVQLPVSLYGILAHGHTPGTTMHFFSQCWPGDPNLTTSSISKFLVNLERVKKEEAAQDCITQEFHCALVDDTALKAHQQERRAGSSVVEPRAGDCGAPQSTPQSASGNFTPRPLPPHLLLQLDNCAGENKNRYLLAYYALLVARGCFKTICVSFLMVGHTDEDVDALFSHVSEALRRESCPTFPHMPKRLSSCVSSGVDSHLITEVADFKDYIKPFLLDGRDKMVGRSKPLTFMFRLKDGVPIMCLWDKEWEPNEGNEVF